MPRLGIIGWQPGLKKISMTKLLREHLGLSLTEAKGATDKVLMGEAVWYFLEDPSKAEDLREALENIGAVVAITEANERKDVL